MNKDLTIDALSAALPPEFDDLHSEIVRFLTARQMRQLSEKTRATYERAYERMRERGVPPEVMGARSRRSFQLYRAVPSLVPSASILVSNISPAPRRPAVAAHSIASSSVGLRPP